MQFENPIRSPFFLYEHDGKVRTRYGIGGAPSVMEVVATDRVSAFDVVMEQSVPGKGAILTLMTGNWIRFLEKFGIIAPFGVPLPENACRHHLISTDLRALENIFGTSLESALTSDEIAYLTGRSMLVRRADHVLPIEFIMRGYLEGTGWASYQHDRTVCGILLPDGIPRCGKLPKTIFAPSTKAERPFHDENISKKRMVEVLDRFFASRDIILGPQKTADRLEMLSHAIYRMAAQYAKERGVIIADTKLEFGLVREGDTWEIMLIDEVLTPDSSRYWDARTYEPGHAQASFDKQPLRDHLEGMCGRGEWNKEPPPPALDADVLVQLYKRYNFINELLFGS